MVNQANVSSTNKNYDKYLMYFSTVQGTPIKTLTEALKEVLTDINIHFNSDGFEVINMDPDQISFVALKLNGTKFEEYHCPSKLLVGVNMMSLHKLLKTIGNNDAISMYVTKENPDKLGIIIQNKKKRIYNKITYNLLDVDLVHIDIPEIDYDAQVTMPCGDFQKYCRELASISNYVTIGVSGDKIFSMTVDGKFASQSLDIEESEDSNVVIDVNDNIQEMTQIGTYSLKFLNLFCKSSTLCATIQLYMKTDYPIIIVYTVASLGTVKFCLCPQNDEE
jgi:proliferating cell nuclear antigen